mmetsp:Transcript_33161/g.78825  ORF Transcript_33161/g.78825 Transcript_33161/m.78825 type:complete len:207 (-) Transcript_33161:80-700(-)
MIITLYFRLRGGGKKLNYHIFAERYGRNGLHRPAGHASPRLLELGGIVHEEAVLRLVVLVDLGPTVRDSLLVGFIGHVELGEGPVLGVRVDLLHVLGAILGVAAQEASLEEDVSLLRALLALLLGEDLDGAKHELAQLVKAGAHALDQVARLPQQRVVRVVVVLAAPHAPAGSIKVLVELVHNLHLALLGLGRARVNLLPRVEDHR